jgi:hypothetical protein
MPRGVPKAGFRRSHSVRSHLRRTRNGYVRVGDHDRGFGWSDNDDGNSGWGVTLTIGILFAIGTEIATLTAPPGAPPYRLMHLVNVTYILAGLLGFVQASLRAHREELAAQAERQAAQEKQDLAERAARQAEHDLAERLRTMPEVERQFQRRLWAHLGPVIEGGGHYSGPLSLLISHEALVQTKPPRADAHPVLRPGTPQAFLARRYPVEPLQTHDPIICWRRYPQYPKNDGEVALTSTHLLFFKSPGVVSRSLTREQVTVEISDDSVILAGTYAWNVDIVGFFAEPGSVASAAFIADLGDALLQAGYVAGTIPRLYRP